MCALCRFVWLCCVLRVGETVSCVVMSTEVTERRTGIPLRGYGTGRSSRATKRFGVQPVYLCIRISWSCTRFCHAAICRLHVRRPTPQMKATRMPAGCVSVVPCFLCVLKRSFVTVRTLLHVQGQSINAQLHEITCMVTGSTHPLPPSPLPRPDRTPRGVVYCTWYS